MIKFPELRPFIKGVEPKLHQRYTPIEIDKPHELEPFRVKYGGFFINGAITLDNPDTIVRLEIDGKEIFKVTPRFLYQRGMTQFQFFPFTTREVPNNDNIYTVCLYPPREYYIERNWSLMVIPPEGTKVKIIEYTFSLLEIVDRNLYYESIIDIISDVIVKAYKKLKVSEVLTYARRL